MNALDLARWQFGIRTCRCACCTPRWWQARRQRD